MPRHSISAPRNTAALITAGALVAGVLAATPFVAHDAEARSRNVALTTELSESTGLRGEQLAVYPARAKTLADIEAQAVIDESNRIIAEARAKVDAAPLQSSVAALGEYRVLDESTVRDRTEQTQRKADATAAAAAEVDRIAAEKAAQAAAQAEAAAAASTPEAARAIARNMAASQYGWGDAQFSCLNDLWQRESGWSFTAYNADSGATGIPQALPGSKMATAGADWQTNPATQIAWGLSYIKAGYGTPCAAWEHSQSLNWY